jgi:UDP:flavonoid glycosyltransferase YjiC (YdhE family)
MLNFTEEHAAYIKASGVGMASPWVLQEAILAHPVVGWYLSHGGWNSTQEALVAKVPMFVMHCFTDDGHFSNTDDRF